MKLSKNKTVAMRKLLLSLISALAVILILTMLSLAWLNNKRTLQTVTTMQMPVLFIKDKNDVETQTLDIGNLDVSQADYKNIAFAVTASRKTDFNIQLAHTTNIPLTYEIYPAQKNGDEIVVGDTKLTGSYLTWDTHVETYGNYNAEYVQLNAEPKYWQASDAQSINESYGMKYYVLRISWNQAINNKETEMIYITVSTKIADVNSSTGGNQ